MKVIIFIYWKNQFEKICNDQNQLIIHIVLEYLSIINKNMKDLYFMWNGKYLSFKNNEKISNFKKNKIKIIVLNLKKKKNNKELNQIICPKCKELVIINFEEDKIIINNCINNHNIIYSSMNELMKNQIIDELECDNIQFSYSFQK